MKNESGHFVNTVVSKLAFLIQPPVYHFISHPDPNYLAYMSNYSWFTFFCLIPLLRKESLKNDK